MVVFPNCKINIGLYITDKRSDGYHNIETVFYPLPWHDALEVLPLTSQIQTVLEKDPSIKITYQTKDILFVQSGLNIEGSATDNLCIKAFYLLKNKYSFPPVFIHLHKIIPSGAGLGGGSSDAAFTLKTIAKIFHLPVTGIELKQLALTLGSDCPFFIQNQPCIASGRGEELQSLSLDLTNYTFVLINPNIHISTAWAFPQIQPITPSINLQHIVQQPIETWKNVIYNDFEKPVFENYPIVKKIKDVLYDKGALYASLSGSGSTVYGIFSKKEKLDLNSFPSSYFIKII